MLVQVEINASVMDSSRTFLEFRTPVFREKRFESVIGDGME